MTDRDRINSLLDVLGEILALHKKESDLEGDFCSECDTEYPCLTVTAIAVRNN